MSTLALESLHDEVSAGNETVMVMVVYEDVVTRATAIETCGRMRQMCNEDTLLEFTWLELDDLRCPDVFANAVDAGRHADVLIISMYARRTVPAVLRKWTSAWVDRRQKLDGALALLTVDNGRGPAACEIETFLKEVAGTAGMDFFERGIAVTAKEAKGSEWEMFCETSHWGINE